MPTDPLVTWKASLASFTNYVDSLSDWGASSTCPGWSIADLVSHTIDLEALLAADPRPAHTPDWAALAHVDSDFGRLTEIGVDYRRGRSRQELLIELGETHARALARVESIGMDGSIPWLLGDTPIRRLLGMRAFDIWMHEQDARLATGDLGNLDGPGAAEAMQYLVAGLPKVWGKGVGAPIGSVLRVVITGPGLESDDRVRVNEDGRAAFVDDSDASVSVTMPWVTFVALAGGRSTSTDYAQAVVVEGDQDLGRAFIDAMAVTP